jgi:hypothetical protein
MEYKSLNNINITEEKTLYKDKNENEFFYKLYEESEHKINKLTN